MAHGIGADPSPMSSALARIDSLPPPVRVVSVAAGYALAFAAAWTAGWMYDVRMAAMPYDTSGGMYAFGQMLASLGVFFVAALPPTALALWLLRRNAVFWLVVAAGSLAFALVGLAGSLLFMTARATPTDWPAMTLELVGLAQFLGVPLWTGAFVLFLALAPTRPARRLLQGAIGVELACAICAAIHWFASRPF